MRFSSVLSAILQAQGLLHDRLIELKMNIINKRTVCLLTLFYLKKIEFWQKNQLVYVHKWHFNLQASFMWKRRVFLVIQQFLFFYIR